MRALPDGATIDAEARRLVATKDVKGLALAVIDGGEIVHTAAYGLRNVERGLPLETDTVMYGASLTKAAVAVLVLQLVDEGLLSLDTPIAERVDLPAHPDFGDLADDERWRALTPRRVLTHTTGFANFRWLEPDGKLRFHADPGTRYGYSGEGFMVLQALIERGLGLDLGAEMQRRLFDPLGMSRTSLVWRPDFAPNLADGYARDGSFAPHDERRRVRAAGSMDTTIADQARLWAAVVRGDGLSRTSRTELVQGLHPITSAAEFPTLVDTTDPRGPAIGLAAGLGVLTFDDLDGRAWFKSGHDDWTANLVFGREQGRRCIVVLSNSVRAERILPALVSFVLGETRMPWWWKYGSAVSP